VALKQEKDGYGELALFFDQSASSTTQQMFDHYIVQYLERNAVPDSVLRRRIFKCNNCYLPIQDELVQSKVDGGYESMPCPRCGSSILLKDPPMSPIAKMALNVRIPQMDKNANNQRVSQAIDSTLSGKAATANYDVFLAHHPGEREMALGVAERLRERGIYVFLDETCSLPERWPTMLKTQAPKTKSVALLFGPSGLDGWNEAALLTFVEKWTRYRVMMAALLPGATNVPERWLRLRELEWAYFFQSLDEKEALDALERGITGRDPRRRTL
jgi:DNA-directed RNA polymerase subunit RPC12/RpoP